MPNTELRVERLRCEYLTTPLAVAAERPRFTWLVAGGGRGARATEYELVVASSAGFAPEDVLWHARAQDDDCVRARYDGPPLEPGCRYWWSVRVVDGAGAATAPATSWFETAPLRDGAWHAQWITLPEPAFARDDFRPVPMLRTTFELDGQPASVRLHVTALGVYEAHLNGQRVGDDVLRPGWTDYRQRVQYQVYDVTDLVAPGRNALGLLVGQGWYAGHWGLDAARGTWGEEPLVAAQLVTTHADGRREVTTATGEAWRGSFGPVLRSDLLLGEIYDARRELPEWSSAGFDDRAWQLVKVAEPPAIELVPERGEPVRRTQEIKPVAIGSPVFKTHVFDMGQNLVGWTRLRLRARRGTEIVVRHGEALSPDGTVYTANLRLAAQTERYICRGGEEEVYEPRFTLHGFRYVEVVNLPDEPDETTITAVVVHSDMARAGELACSNELVSRLQSNIVWTQRGNFVEVPTDCPQRNERLGWLGDARSFAPTACLNYDAAAFFTRWLDEVLIARTPEGRYPDIAPSIAGDDADELVDGMPKWSPEGAPGWADGGVFIPWTLYEEYGDDGILEQHYPAMSRFVDLLRDDNPALIRRTHMGMNWGDHLSMPEPHDPALGRGEGNIIDSIYSTTPKDLFATAFFKRDAELVSRTAAVLGREDDARRYAALAEAVREAFCREFVDADGRLAGDTQTAYALALEFGLLPETLQARAGEHLVAAVARHGGRLSTGTTGTELLLPALTRSGRVDLAFDLLLQEEYPSWGFSIRNGATTIWERWDGWTPERGFQDIRMNSLNQYGLGSVGAWLYANVGGIERLTPGYRAVRIRPRPHPAIASASASHRSVRGPIAVRWEARDGGMALDVEVPPGCEAQVHLPVPDGGTATEGEVPVERADGVRRVGSEEGCEVFAIGSGSYRFRSA